MVGGTVLKGHRVQKVGNWCAQTAVSEGNCPAPGPATVSRPQELSLLTGALYLQHPAQPPYTFYRSRIFMKNRSATSTVDYTTMIRKQSFMFRPEDFFF